MCYHRLYIFQTCGHSLFSLGPIHSCAHSSIAPDSTFSATCQPRAHPLHSFKVESLCLACQRQRDAFLAEIDERQQVKFEDWRWRVAYRSSHADAEAWRHWGEDVGGVAEMFKARKAKMKESAGA